MEFDLTTIENTEFSKEDLIATLEVIESMYNSGEYMQRILESLKIPKHRFFRIVETVPQISQEYSQAQRARAELVAEEIIEISDTELDPMRGRNRILARQWYASKMKPQKFGERIDLNITQVVDIGSALNDASKRVKDVQSTVITKEITQRVTGDAPADQDDLLK